MNLSVLNFHGVRVGEMAVPKGVLVPQVNYHLIWEAIKAEQANKRQGTHKTKTKGEVSGGGQKPWRQKGTGRARQGSIRNPQWRHGGIVFGPLPRDYSEDFPKRKKAVAYQHIFTSKVTENQVVVLEEISLEKPATKVAFQALAKIIKAAPFAARYQEGRKIRDNSNKNRRTITLVMDSDNANHKKSLRNLPWLNTLHVDRLSAETLYLNHGIIITKAALLKLAEKYKS